MKLTLEVPDGYKLEVSFIRTDSGAKQEAERALRSAGFGVKGRAYPKGVGSSQVSYPRTAAGANNEAKEPIHINAPNMLYDNQSRRLSFTDYESGLDNPPRAYPSEGPIPPDDLPEAYGTDAGLEGRRGWVPLAESSGQSGSYLPLDQNRPSSREDLSSLRGYPSVGFLVEDNS